MLDSYVPTMLWLRVVSRALIGSERPNVPTGLTGIWGQCWSGRRERAALSWVLLEHGLGADV